MSAPKYRRTVTRAGRTVEVRCTYPTRYGDGLTRERHRDGPGTPEAMARYNEQLQQDKLTLLINDNFVPEDLWVTLHYERDRRPGSYAEARKVLSSFVRKLRLLYQTHGTELRAIKCTAFGERGGVHHHLIIPQGVPQREISALWKTHIRASQKARPPSFVALYDSGEYSGIAAYILGQKQSTGDDEKFVRKWTGTRNLKRPKPEKDEMIDKISWKEPPTPWPGYYIDTDSIRAGCNEITGKPYLRYLMIRIPPGFVCWDASGKRLTGAAAVKWYRENNKAYIKQNWIDLNPEGEVVFKDKNKKGVQKNE